MSDERLDQARQTLNSLPPDRKMPGLVLNVKSYDHYSDSYHVLFTWDSKSAEITFSEERMKEARSDNRFALRHLRNQIRAAFKLDQET